MAASETTEDPDSGGKTSRKFLRANSNILICSVGIVALCVALWFGNRIRQRNASAAVAAVAAQHLRARNVLITGSPVDTANLTNRTLDDELIDWLSKLVTLKTLNLKRAEATDEQLARILPKLNLISLVLSATPITDGDGNGSDPAKARDIDPD